MERAGVRGRTKIAIGAKIDDQEPVIFLLTSITQHESRRSDHGSIHSIACLLRDDRILAPEPQQILVQPVTLTVPLSLRPINFRALEDGRLAGISDGCLSERRSITRKLGQELLSPLVYLSGQLARWEIGEE